MNISPNAIPSHFMLAIDSIPSNTTMAPNRETLVSTNSYTKSTTTPTTTNVLLQKPSPCPPPAPPRLSMETLQRTISDMSFELTKESSLIDSDTFKKTTMNLPSISEIEDAKCECCGMCEECTPEYISRVRSKFSGKLMCGLCQEAVKEEMEKNGGKREEALSEHMNACVRFNRFGRTHPVLFQAEAMKEMLKKSSVLDTGRDHRAKSLSPRDRNQKKGAGTGGITRSTSCIPAITKEITTDRKVVN